MVESYQSLQDLLGEHGEMEAFAVINRRLLMREFICPKDQRLTSSVKCQCRDDRFYLKR